MLILYDINHTKICGLTNYKELKIEREINIEDTLSFQFPIVDAKHNLIQEECYIRTEDNEYVVKEVNAEDDDFNEYVCKINVEDLTGNTISHFETVEQTCSDSVNLAIAGTGWTIGSCDVVKLRTVRKNNCSSYDILVEIQAAYGCEMTFDSINKRVNIYQQMGSDKGAYFAEQLNLKKLTVQRNSYDYITRLIPIGKDGLDITSVNGGINYIENHQYSAKVMAAYWEDNRYTVAQDLYDDAIVRLDYLSKPLKAYKADILDLVNLSDTYKSVFDYDLGDIITLLSKSKGTKEKQRIIKLTMYPDEPERNTVEIANKITSLEQLQVRFQDTSNTVDDMTTTAGEVDGSKVDAIDYSKIQNVSIGTADIQDAAIVTVKIGSAAITTEKVADSAITTAKIENAAITTAKIANAAITTALIADAAINSTQIADGSITDAKIVDLTADKIAAGTLSVQRLIITGSDQSIVFAINEANGTAQLSQTTIDGGSLTERTITADRIVAGAITANEMAANTITANSGIIASIDAGKITTGTLDASKITVSNLSASSINTGTLSADRICGGILTLGDNSNTNGTELVKDANGNIILSIDSGGIVANQGNIKAVDVFYNPNAPEDPWNGSTWQTTLSAQGIQVSDNDFHNVGSASLGVNGISAEFTGGAGVENLTFGGGIGATGGFCGYEDLGSTEHLANRSVIGFNQQTALYSDKGNLDFVVPYHNSSYPDYTHICMMEITNGYINCFGSLTATTISVNGGTRLNGGYDLNQLTFGGWYDVDSPANGIFGNTWHNILNCPSADSNYITQFAFGMVDNLGTVCVRPKAYGTWHAWQRILTTDHFSDKAIAVQGDSVGSADMGNGVSHWIKVAGLYLNNTYSNAHIVLDISTRWSHAKVKLNVWTNDQITSNGWDCRVGDAVGGCLPANAVWIGAVYNGGNNTVYWDIWVNTNSWSSMTRALDHVNVFGYGGYDLYAVDNGTTIPTGNYNTGGYAGNTTENDRFMGNSNNDLMYIGSGACRFDTTGGTLRMYSSDVGTPDCGVRTSNGQTDFMANNSQVAYVTASGAIHGSSKSAMTETVDYGRVTTYSDESPSHVHNDRGRGILDENGECIIVLDPIMVETVNTQNGDYYIQLTGIKTSNVYIDDLQPDYFVVKGTPGAEFFWQFTAERLGWEHLRWNDADAES